MPFVTKYKSWLLIVVGTVVWSLTMIKSGLRYDYGLGFWGANGHDGVWHLALIESLSRGSGQMPIFAGEAIKNYHLGFDVLLAVIHRLSGIPSSVLYFQLTPPLLAIAIGWLTYKYTRNNWAVFFVYFGGSLGWLVGTGESAFWSTQAISTLVNPPFALSIVLILLALLLLQKQRWVLAGLVLALLPHIKIYGGLLAFAGLLLASVRNRNLLKTLGVGMGIYLLTNYRVLTSGSSLLVWQPGWYLETMMGLSDRLNWPRFFSAMTNYRLSQNWLKAVPAYLAAFAVFWIGNMGTRLVKEGLVLGWVKKWRNLGWEEIFFATVIVAGGIIPMFFLQTGTPWNTIQFFYYSLFFSGLLAGVAMSKITNKLLIVLIIGLTLPTTRQTLQHYLPARPPAMLSNQEIQALQFLSGQPRGVVLTYPYDPIAAKQAEANPPRPLYLYESTAYVAAFSKQPVYLEDEVNLNITGYSWQDRRQQSLDFFATSDPNLAQKFLDDNSISYIYLAEVAKSRPKLSDTQLGMKNIFENSQAAIWAKAGK